MFINDVAFGLSTVVF